MAPLDFLCINSNIWPNSTPVRNLSYIDFEFARLFKVKYDGGIGLPIFGFPWMCKNNIWSNWAP